jgi:hypothetical protein
MDESKLEAYLVQAVAAAGGFCYKFTSPGRRGVPDRLAVFPGGEFVFFEVKSPTGRMSHLQQFEINRLRKLGARVEVVSTRDEVAEALSS